MLLDLKISKVVYGGEGLGRFNGKVCFVEGALEGERVLADLTQEKKNFSRAKTLKVLLPNPHRQEPACPYYGFCGGCQYQHCDYPEELRCKQLQLKDFFESSLPKGAGEALRPILHAPECTHYRNAVTLHAGFRIGRKTPEVGFIAKDNRTIIPVGKCLIADERLGAVFHRAVAFGDRLRTKDSERIGFRLAQDGRIFSSRQDLFMRIKLRDQSVIASAKGFFQCNLAVTELLIDRVGAWVQEKQPETLFDLYAGVGMFSLFCAAEVPRVFLVEEELSAASSARMNAEERKLANFHVIEDRAERVFAGLWQKNHSDAGMIIVDPPRQGLDRRLCEFIRDHVDARAIAYVSCDPATLVRDLKIILGGGRYKIEEAVGLDMFPRTRHIETAVLLAPL